MLAIGDTQSDRVEMHASVDRGRSFAPTGVTGPVFSQALSIRDNAILFFEDMGTGVQPADVYLLEWDN